MKYILYGAGQRGKEALKFFGSENVLCFCDSFLFGNTLEGKKIISFEELKEIQEEYRLVITPANSVGVVEIIAKVNSGGFDFTMYEDEVRLVKIYQAMKQYAHEARELKNEEYQDEASKLARNYDYIEFAYIDVTRIGEMMSLLIISDGNEYGENRTKNVFVPWFSIDGKELLFAEKRNANKYLYKKIAELLELLTKNNINFWLRFMEENWNKCKFNNRYSHINMIKYQRISILRKKVFEKRYLEWARDELQDGNAGLASMGLKTPYVCFFGRSQKYLDTVFNRNTIHPNDYIRNQPIDNYKLMCKELGKLGIMSVRMGYMVDQSIAWENVIDYASNYRSEFMDLYAISQSEFFISCPSGIQLIATMFGIPSILVDVPLLTSVNDIGHWLIPDKDLMIFQKIRDRNGTYLSLKELFTIEEIIPNHYERMAYFLDNGYSFEKNTPREIWEVAKEMLDRINGSISYTPEDNQLQDEYWNLVHRFLSRRKQPLNWYAQARVGRDFLRQNKWLLK